MHPTVLVLTFNESLDPTRAADVKNYKIVGLSRRPVQYCVRGV